MKVTVLIVLAALSALAFFFDVLMIRRSICASALLHECGSPSEKQQVLASIRSLRGEHEKLMNELGKLRKEEQDSRQLAQARGLELATVKGALDALNDDLERAADFRRLMTKATADGNYLELMRVEHAPAARAENGDLKDVGSRFLRGGYWVYAHPYWFVWSRCRRDEAEAEKRRKQQEAEAARSSAEWQRQKQLEEKYGSRIDAEDMAEQFVKQHLTHPSTARFPFFSGGGAFVNAANGHWHVGGTVKAKNAFGLELTYRWRVVLRRVTADRWELVDIEMWEEGS